MPENIKELIKTLLKNKLITVQEVAMLKANKKEDKDQLIALVQRLYEKGEVVSGDVAVILVNEDNVLELLDYITSEPISLNPTQYPDNGIKIVPSPYIPCPSTSPWTLPNTPSTDPFPGRPDIVYCAHNQNTTIA